MTAELVAGIVALLVTLIGGSVGWQQIREHGAEKERRKRAEGDRNEAQARVEAAAKPPASRDEAARILRARLDRLHERLRKARGGDL